MKDTPDFHSLQAEAQLAIDRQRGIFRLLAVAAQFDVAIDNETLAAVSEGGLVAADDAQKALEEILAQVFSRNCTA
jgi:hypothetical protein